MAWSAGLRPASRGSAKPAPTTLAPPISRLRTHASPTAQNHGDMERRSPTGIARERETRTNNTAPRQSHGGAPVSDRHRAGARNPHQRRWPRQSPPISRGHGAPVSDRHRAGARNLHRRRWPRQSHGGAPVSDRHRAGARNPHQQHRTPPISRWSAGLRPASRPAGPRNHVPPTSGRNALRSYRPPTPSVSKTER